MSTAQVPGRKVSLPGMSSNSAEPGPLRRFTSTSALTFSSPLPSSPAPRSPGKICLNQYQIKGLACLQEQELAKSWMEAVLGIKLKNEFGNSISNGVLLCNLMNKIRAGSIPNIHQAKAQQVYLSIENINFFLAACLEMGVAFTDIFNPLELYEMRNIPKVVKCVLSMGYIATKLGFIPPLLYSPSISKEDRQLETTQADIIELNGNTSTSEETNFDFDDEFTFSDLDRTITELDTQKEDGESNNEIENGSYLESGSWNESPINSSGSSSSEREEQMDNEGSPNENDKQEEYTFEQLKSEYPLVDPLLLFNPRRLESVGKTALAKHEPLPVHKYHYEPNAKDPADQALADYINNKFTLEVPPDVSLPKPIIRLGNGKYRFGDKVFNLKLTNGIILVRIGGGWTKLKEVLVRLNSMAACTALKEKTSNSILQNISEWDAVPKAVTPPLTPLRKSASFSLTQQKSPSPTPLSSTSSPFISPSLSTTITTTTSTSDNNNNNVLENKTSSKPFPKIPPLKLPVKSSTKPTLSAKPPALSLAFMPSSLSPRKKNQSRSLPVSPRSSSDFPKRISSQLSLPNLISPSSSPSHSSSSPTSSSSTLHAPLSFPSIAVTPPLSSRGNRNSLPLSLSRSLSSPSPSSSSSSPSSPSSSSSVPSTPRRATLSENQLFISLSRSNSPSSSSPTTPTTPTTPTFPTSPTSHSPHSPSSFTLQPSTPRYIPNSPRPSSSSSPSPRPNNESSSQDSTSSSSSSSSPLRGPLVSLAPPKFATLKGKTS